MTSSSVIRLTDQENVEEEETPSLTDSQAAAIHSRLFETLRAERLAQWVDYGGATVVDSSVTTHVPPRSDTASDAEGHYVKRRVPKSASRWCPNMIRVAQISFCVLFAATATLFCILIATDVSLFRRHGFAFRDTSSLMTPSAFTVETEDGFYLFLTDAAQGASLIRAFSRKEPRKWLWTIVNGTVFRAATGEVFAIKPIPMINWSAGDFWFSKSPFQRVSTPLPLDHEFALLPLFTPSASAQEPRIMPRVKHLRVALARSLVDDPTVTSSFPPTMLNSAAVIEQYEVTGFDPATQSFIRISPNLSAHSLIVNDTYVNSTADILTTFVWPTDNSSWCSSTVRNICDKSLPSCACLLERGDRLVNYAEYNGCDPCVASDDPGCACWAKVWQYQQLLVAQPCYARMTTGLSVGPAISYPCRAPFRCTWDFDRTVCTHEVQLCHDVKVRALKDYCWL